MIFISHNHINLKAKMFHKTVYKFLTRNATDVKSLTLAVTLADEKQQYKPRGQPSRNGSTMSAFCSGTKQTEEENISRHTVIIRPIPV